MRLGLEIGEFGVRDESQLEGRRMRWPRREKNGYFNRYRCVWGPLGPHGAMVQVR